jgi:CII-binding regulator of phage lambda lysogenization HflD
MINLDKNVKKKLTLFTNFFENTRKSEKSKMPYDLDLVRILERLQREKNDWEFLEASLRNITEQIYKRQQTHEETIALIKTILES